MSAERLFGLNYTSFKSGEGDRERTIKDFRFTALWSDSPRLDEGIPNPSVLPRLAGDFVVAPNVTVGAALGIAYGSLASEGRRTVSFLGFLASPRIGYVIPLDGGSAFWLRGGVGLFRAGASREGESLAWTSVFATLDPQFVAQLAPGTAFAVGPVIDFPLTGSIKEDDRPSQPLKAMSFGVTTALLAHF